jgi:hypothetical protein
VSHVTFEASPVIVQVYHHPPTCRQGRTVTVTNSKAAERL